MGTNEGVQREHQPFGESGLLEGGMLRVSLLSEGVHEVGMQPPTSSQETFVCVSALSACGVTNHRSLMGNQCIARRCADSTCSRDGTRGRANGRSISVIAAG